MEPPSRSCPGSPYFPGPSAVLSRTSTLVMQPCGYMTKSVNATLWISSSPSGRQPRQEKPFSPGGALPPWKLLASDAGRDAHKRACGERVGTVPFGYRVASDGLHLEVEPGEQAVAAQVGAMKASGFTLRRITAELDQRGLTTSYTIWRHQYVAQVDRSTRLCSPMGATPCIVD